jgi:molybdenum cofactor biosynthesis enzyme MoaA
MFRISGAQLLVLNRLIASNRVKFAGVLAADLLGIRYTIVRFDPVVACNLRCGMCYFSDETWYRDNVGSRFTPDQVTRIAEIFFPEALQLYVGCGSEPTMWKGYPDIVGIAKKKGVPFVSLVTNAQLLNRAAVEALVEHGLDEIIVSVHGTRQETYESLMKGAKWQRLHDNLALIDTVRRERNSSLPKIRLNYTVNNDNAEQMAELMAVFGPYGIDTIQIRPIADLGDTAYQDKDLTASLPVYEAGIRRLRQECAQAGTTLLANLTDPLFQQNNAKSVVYENAVLRYVSPQRVWVKDYDPHQETYPALKRRTGFRKRLLRWALAGSKELEHATMLTTSDVL